MQIHSTDNKANDVLERVFTKNNLTTEELSYLQLHVDELERVGSHLEHHEHHDEKEESPKLKY